MGKSKIGENERMFIKENYLKIPTEELADKLDISISTIYKIAKDVGVKSDNYRWTPEKIQFLKEHYFDAPWEYLMEKLAISDKMVITSKASKLGLKRNLWFSENDIEFVKENYDKMTYDEIGKIIGKDPTNVAIRVGLLGLRKTKDWTEEDIELLKEIYPIYTNKYLSEKYFVGRKPASIRTKALEIGLHKTEEKSVKWYDKEKMLDQLKQLATNLGRTPLYNELCSNGLPSDRTYQRYFGGYRNACMLADLEVNFTFFGKPAKDLYSRNGDYCFSYSEVTITNFLIDNKINYKKEEKYSSHIDDERCGYKRADWFLDDGTFVEYFGMPQMEEYYEKMEQKRSICRDNNIKLLELFEKDLNNLHIVFSAYLN